MYNIRAYIVKAVKKDLLIMISSMEETTLNGFEKRYILVQNVIFDLRIPEESPAHAYYIVNRSLTTATGFVFLKQNIIDHITELSL